MTAPTLRLTIITQDRELLSEDVESVTVPTTEGEITVLPQHIPLFARLQVGELVYRINSTSHSVVVSRGFIEVSPDSKVTIMADVAAHEREIVLEKAEAAVHAAQETMKQTVDQHELMMADAELKRALLEVKVAQKTRRGTTV